MIIQLTGSILGLGLGLFNLQVPYQVQVQKYSIYRFHTRYRFRIIQFTGSVLGLGLGLYSLQVPYQVQVQDYTVYRFLLGLGLGLYSLLVPYQVYVQDYSIYRFHTRFRFRNIQFTGVILCLDSVLFCVQVSYQIRFWIIQFTGSILKVQVEDYTVYILFFSITLGF